MSRRDVPVVRIDKRRRMRHGSHAIVTVLSVGLWAPVWVALAARERRYLRSIGATR